MTKKGYDIKIINPTNLAISERYNPLEFIKVTSEKPIFAIKFQNYESINLKIIQ